MPLDLPIDKKLKDAYAETPGFALFWKAYPKKIGKAYAHRCWVNQGCEPFAQQITDDVIERKQKHPQWTNDNGTYVPHPSTYINQHLWTEEIPQPQPIERQLSLPQMREWAKQQGIDANPGEDWGSYDRRISAMYEARTVN